MKTLKWAGAALAAAWMAGAQAAVVDPYAMCKQEKETLCQQESRNGEKLQRCLMDNKDKLTRNCKETVEKQAEVNKK